jgi:dissimilatory sulfite reductase (desulfoviridin) alpha/beta subunit
MPEKRDANCAHGSIKCETVDATGANIKITVVRCTHCGEAIGAFLPQLPDTLNRLGEKLDAIQEDIQNLRH